MMKRILLSFAALAALVSCVKENPVGDENQNSAPAQTQSISFEAIAPASSDEADTKTTLVDGNLVHWSKGDQVKVMFVPNNGWGATFPGKAYDGASGILTSTQDADAAKSTYFYTESWDWIVGAEHMGVGIAVYPSSVYTYSHRKDDYYYSNAPTIISYDLPTIQTAVENTFQNEILFSYAEIADVNEFAENNAKLNFKNACSLIKITLPADAADIVSIEVTSSNVGLAGTYKVDPAKGYSGTSGYTQYYPIYPLKMVAESAVNSVTLSAPAGEPLKAGASYYIVAWPGTHPSGLQFTFTNSEGLYLTKKASQEVVLEASEIDHFNFKSSFTFAQVFEVSENSIDIDSEAATGSFTVTSTRDWTATSDSDWLTITPASGSASVSATTVSFNASGNTSASERTATVTIKAGEDTKTITVTQAGFVPELSIERYKNWSTLTWDGKDFQFVTIKSNTNWTLTCDQNWLTVGTAQGGATTGLEVMVEATKNESTSERSATLYLRDLSGTIEKTFTVTQAGRPLMYYIVNQVTEASALENDGLYVIEFFNNDNYYWKVDNYGNVTKSYFANKSDAFPEEYIYRLEKTAYSNPLTDYYSYSTGHLWSVKMNMFFDWYDLNFSDGHKTDLVFENKYRGENGSEIDIYEHYNNPYRTIYWTGSKLAWGDKGQANRKWNIYKVEPR